MKEINFDTWERRPHFLFFKSVAYPIYNITFDVDVTPVRMWAQEQNVSFSLALIHLSMKALNSVENFRYRLRGETVVLHEITRPSFTDMNSGSELFKMVNAPMEDDIKTFIAKAKEISQKQTVYFPFEEWAGRDDFVFFSLLPWVSFSAIDHTVNLKQGDAVPRVTLGKFREENGRVLLPYNVQVNHLFVDGIHLGKFKDALDREIAGLV